MRYEIGWNECTGVGHCVKTWRTLFETDSEDVAKKTLLRYREIHPSAVCVDSKDNYKLIEP